jgi:hypothetical protein
MRFQWVLRCSWLVVCLNACSTKVSEPPVGIGTSSGMSSGTGSSSGGSSGDMASGGTSGSSSGGNASSSGDPPPPPATCTDGIKNNSETDVDCGPGCSPCADTKLCSAASNCESLVCTAGRCASATAYDGVKNGKEVDIDCGAESGRKCADRKNCRSASDCVSSDCKAGLCQVSAGDGLRNGDESDIDCGGSKAPQCADARRCKTGSDCVSQVCIGKICQTASHTDDVKNLDEVDVDCGGPDTKALRCTNGKVCAAASDCASNSCSAATKRCQSPPPDNMVKDGEETDIDCGGPIAPACAPTKGCKVGADCQSLICTLGVCTAPSPTDGVKNGDESDKDCGGTNARKCNTGETCIAHADCASDGCGYDNKCVSARSCTNHFGGDTCGSGEVGNVNASHESCCRSR